jgi:hypothetical protein
MIPLVDILYFAVTITIVAGMAVFIIRSMRSPKDEPSEPHDTI